jgi:nucleotide-binding universal stress UspA family protein
MTISTLMVCLDVESDNRAQLSVAGTLAERLSACVIGVTARDAVPGLYFAEGAHAAELFDQERDRLKQRMADAERQFRSALQPLAKTLEWRSLQTNPGDFVATQARAADLIIIGSNPGGSAIDPASQLDPGDVVLRAGRPVLIVPPSVMGLKGKHALIAWKDTREARRAVSDSLPLLKHADEVTLVRIIEASDDKAAIQASLADISSWLGRHGVKAATISQNPTGKPDQLGTMAADLGADLIVAGAYGHSRLREWAWGGVTRDLLTRTKSCSFVSH